MERTAAAATRSMEAPPARRIASEPAALEEIAISCYENDVPAFIEPELERLYGSIYSSLPQFRVYTDGSDTSVYIARRGGRIAAIFLFRQRGPCVQVLNEVMRVEDDDVACFARYVFATYPTAAVIAFKAVETAERSSSRLPFPRQRHRHTEDIVLALPDSADAYFEMLSKGTRRHFKRRMRKLQDELPSWKFRFLLEDDIDESTVRAVVELNRARMAGKHKASAIADDEIGRIARLARERGIAGIIEIDGRICAGAVGFRAGGNYFLSVLAHDPRYDRYWLGILCCYHTICECIARGGEEFHFLWGEYDYKTMLMGVKRDLHNLLVYRSRAHRIRHADIALTAAAGAAFRATRSRLHALVKRLSRAHAPRAS
ncbi:MAG TPA: GNAT family N-acetyltransferase [Paucimonas sp.]|nr:GNAT family N-acetyltransferase [Paucimonas sp.]